MILYLQYYFAPSILIYCTNLLCRLRHYSINHFSCNLMLKSVLFSEISKILTLFYFDRIWSSMVWWGSTSKTQVRKSQQNVFEWPQMRLHKLLSKHSLKNSVQICECFQYLSTQFTRFTKMEVINLFNFMIVFYNGRKSFSLVLCDKI